MNEDQIINALNLGSSREALDGSPKSPLSKLLQSQVNDIIKELRTKLREYDANASRNLAQSIEPTPPMIKGDVVSIEVSAPFYWKFVNYGVNGSLVNRGAPNWGTQPTQQWSMSEALKEWERDRGIKYVDGVSNWTSKSHVEGMGLTERGQIPRPFFSDVVNESLVRELAEPISKLMKRAITIKIIEPWQ